MYSLAEIAMKSIMPIKNIYQLLQMSLSIRKNIGNFILHIIEKKKFRFLFNAFRFLWDPCGAFSKIT
jgi:hypothetical protein